MKTQGSFKKGHKSFQGNANQNSNWKGDKVGMTGLHLWVKSRLPKPEKCEKCKIKPPHDLANKGIYDRDLKNWWYLCRTCHMKLDGRFKNLNHQGWQCEDNYPNEPFYAS